MQVVNVGVGGRLCQRDGGAPLAGVLRTDDKGDAGNVLVKEKDVEANRVILCSNDELFTSELDAKDFNWIAFDCPDGPIRCNARVRYKHTEQPAIVTPTGPNSVYIEFETPVRAISKGQAVVLYDGDTVIGGGTIL